MHLTIIRPNLTLPGLTSKEKMPFLLIFVLVSALLIEFFFLLYSYYYQANNNLPLSYPQQEILVQAEASQAAVLGNNVDDLSAHSGYFSVLLAGIDRRHRWDESFRSDINLIATFTPDRKKVLLTSIPRDLWIDNSRINAFITSEGIEALQEKVSQVTGLTINRYIQIDFDALVEGVNALGGVAVEVQRTFTDFNYPNDRSGKEELITVTFEEGVQHMDGETALIFSRSRKGDNGEGSDFARMLRQQQVLKAMPKAFFSPQCLFNPFVLHNFYTAVTGQMKTDFSLQDVSLAYDLLVNHQEVTVEHFVIDHDLLYQPPPADYGGAYVLRPKDENFNQIKELIKLKLASF